MCKPLVLSVVVLIFPGPAWGQGVDAALRDRVAQLVERLDSPKLETSKAAEEGLIKLGPRVLPLLPDS
ncbi:MAG: hypothetical protein WKF75_08140, partial [Singulisphaera sp.]